MTGFDHVEHSATRLSDLSDLSDFCQSWPDLNGQVSDRRLSEAIGDEDLRELVAWMRRLCDRVSVNFNPCRSEPFEASPFTRVTEIGSDIEKAL